MKCEKEIKDKLLRMLKEYEQTLSNKDLWELMHYRQGYCEALEWVLEK